MIIREVTIGNCRLIQGDCLQVMPLLDWDVTLIDPPYGIAYVHGAEKRKHGSKHNNKPIIGDDKPFDPVPFLDKPCIAWGANNYAAKLPPMPSWFIWDKRCGLGGGPDQADCEVAWSNLGHPARCFNHYWSGFSRDSERGVPRVHPTQKPIAVMEWCLKFMPEGTVLDAFMGSGTTGVACVNLGRKFIGIELDADYFDIAVRRIADAHRQADMFVTKPPIIPPTQEVLI